MIALSHAESPDAQELTGKQAHERTRKGNPYNPSCKHALAEKVVNGGSSVRRFIAIFCEFGIAGQKIVCMCDQASTRNALARRVAQTSVGEIMMVHSSASPVLLTVCFGLFRFLLRSRRRPLYPTFKPSSDSSFEKIVLENMVATATNGIVLVIRLKNILGVVVWFLRSNIASA